MEQDLRLLIEKGRVEDAERRIISQVPAPFDNPAKYGNRGTGWSEVVGIRGVQQKIANKSRPFHLDYIWPEKASKNEEEILACVAGYDINEFLISPLSPHFRRQKRYQEDRDMNNKAAFQRSIIERVISECPTAIDFREKTRTIGNAFDFDWIANHAQTSATYKDPTGHKCAAHNLEVIIYGAQSRYLDYFESLVEKVKDRNEDLADPQPGHEKREKLELSDVGSSTRSLSDVTEGRRDHPGGLNQDAILDDREQNNFGVSPHS
jgi:hypothetical protein